MLDFPQKVKVEDVKTTLSCETFLKKWNSPLSQRRFRGTDDTGSLCNAWFVRPAWHFKPIWSSAPLFKNHLSSNYNPKSGLGAQTMREPPFATNCSPLLFPFTYARKLWIWPNKWHTFTSFKKTMIPQANPLISLAKIVNRKVFDNYCAFFPRPIQAEHRKHVRIHLADLDFNVSTFLNPSGGVTWVATSER